MSYVHGMDIGYSALKTSSGYTGRQPRQQVLPSGAMPIKDLGLAINGDDVAGCRVMVDGEEYVAGIPSQFLGSNQRTLDADYPSTKQYKALFLASLAMADRPVIDQLVTGLPVKQCKQAGRIENLKKQLTGIHQISPGHAVEVRDVSIVPQPIGAYSAAYEEFPEHRDLLAEGVVLCVDPGFFSTDTTLLAHARVQKEGTDGSELATSKLFEAASQYVYTKYGAQVSVEKIETAVQAGSDKIIIGGRYEKLAPIVQAVSEEVIGASLAVIRRSLRNQADGVDAIVLAGGGSQYWEQPVRDAFPNSVFLAFEKPVTANAYGFWAWGAG